MTTKLVYPPAAAVERVENAYVHLVNACPLHRPYEMCNARAINVKNTCHYGY